MTVKIDGTNTVANPAFTGADTDTGLQCGTNELKLVTGGTARATVDSSGNLGVGTESPSRLLTVQSTGNANLCIKSGTSGVSQCMFGDTDSDVAGNIAYRHSDNAMVFEVNLSERMRILSGGGLTFNGDTAAANALDDYEEGTWTPSYSCTNANFTYSDQSGLYTKIGNIVHVNFRILTSSRISGTGALYVDGLPFTPTGDRCVLNISPAFSNWGSNNAPYGGFTSTNGMILLKKVDNSDARALRDTNIDPSIISTAGIIGSMSYKIA